MNAVLDEFDAGAKRFGLTAREREVMWRIRAGDSTGQIADRLRVSPVTVVARVRNFNVKTAVGKRSASIAKILGLTAPNHSVATE